MESEIARLQYVAEKTNIPVPRVYRYNLCNDNGVGGPDMLMEMVFGKSLEQCIKCCSSITHVEVQRILNQMLYYLFKLDKFASMVSVVYDSVNPLIIHVYYQSRSRMTPSRMMVPLIISYSSWLNIFHPLAKMITLRSLRKSSGPWQISMIRRRFRH